MAAGLTDYDWTTTELLFYRVPMTFLNQLNQLETLFPTWDQKATEGNTQKLSSVNLGLCPYRERYFKIIMSQIFQESLILLSLTIMPESDTSQRGNRKVFISLGKNGEIPIIRACILAQLYDCELIGSLIDDYAERCLTEPMSPVFCEPGEPIPLTALTPVLAEQPSQPYLF